MQSSWRFLKSVVIPSHTCTCGFSQRLQIIMLLAFLFRTTGSSSYTLHLDFQWRIARRLLNQATGLRQLLTAKFSRVYIGPKLVRWLTTEAKYVLKQEPPAKTQAENSEIAPILHPAFCHWFDVVAVCGSFAAGRKSTATLSWPEKPAVLTPLVLVVGRFATWSEFLTDTCQNQLWKR